jgi:U3 small nucleolar RNA-associated protein 5
MPDLVTRLSSLYATLTARLALRDPLLALSGRLELMLSQIELRASAGPTILAPESKATGQKGIRSSLVNYVEGESDDSDDNDEGGAEEMEVEDNDSKGSIEDVELGADSADSGSDESGQSESEEEELDSEEGEELRFNGFIDDEAEEWSEEDEDLEE